MMEGQEWVERVERLFEEVQEGGPICLRRARWVLTSGESSSSEQERALLGLAGHPDPAAGALLGQPGLRLRAPRVRFTHQVARRWRSRRGELGGAMASEGHQKSGGLAGDQGEEDLGLNDKKAAFAEDGDVVVVRTGVDVDHS